MPAIRLPQQEGWRGIYPGKHAGSLWQTHNIDLEKSEGRIVLADKARIVADTADLTGLTVTARKFIVTNADTSTGATYRWWALTGVPTVSSMFKSADTSGQGWTQDTTANTPVDAEDMIVFGAANGEQRLLVSQDSDMAILNRAASANAWTANWWVTTLGQAGLDSDVYHFLGNLNTLALLHDQDSDGFSVIHTIDNGDIVTRNRIRFPMEFECRGMLNLGRYTWFALQNNAGRQGALIPWDGFSRSYEDGNFFFDGSYPLAVFAVNGTPYVITETGLIQKYNGNGFSTEQQFPMVEEKVPWAISRRAFSDDAGINPYGVSVKGNLVKILVSASPNSRRMRSGVWHFNAENKNLYHYAGVGRHKTAGTDVGYGGFMGIPGGLANLGPDDTGGELLIGATTGSNATTFAPVIAHMVFNEVTTTNGGRNRGYFITPYLKGEDIQEFWSGLWLKFRRFINNGNIIRVFYRNVDSKRDADGGDDSVLQVTGTWVTTTTFTAPVPTGVVVGESIEVVRGPNAGSIYPISALSGTPDGAASLTVTIQDTAIQSSTDTFLARFDNFRLAQTISDTSISNYFANLPGGDSDATLLNVGEEMQFLVELRGFSQEIKEIISTHNVSRGIEP